jgi:energy-converting hydrogenase Eha subunit B
MFGSLGVPELLALVVVGAVSAIIVIWPAARICAKAGYSPWLGLAAVIPIANLLLLWFLAIAEWPQRRAA